MLFKILNVLRRRVCLQTCKHESNNRLIAERIQVNTKHGTTKQSAQQARLAKKSKVFKQHGWQR